ncbi:MAG TPA: 4Fe-4S dicluster domain-containing protein [Bacteroidales bacterium]|nr:4Fe-4S dicluster domain-containing protein [Bacteroidales bacterium]HPS15912.1 4Fe-4S dicluster domain-containing protein [Bacteroidales bacterium]
MGELYNKLQEDIRFQEGIKACINCGTCTAICPAAEFYNYDPRMIADTVQSKDDDEILALLKGEQIWYCGECMSCKTRCPRGNTPGLIICALRSLSQDLGYFTESEKGRQQLAIKRTVGQWTLDYGYCLYLEGVTTSNHPEQGPIWDWKQKNWRKVFDRLGANYKGEGPGILRKIPEEALDELRKIFEVSGGNERFRKIEEFSKKKAEELNMKFDETNENEYFNHVFSHNSNKHFRED